MTKQANSAVTGSVFRIQRFSLHDGSGIRTVVFLAGCPLRCQWCHNPEGLAEAVDPACRYTVSQVLHEVCRDQAYYLTSHGGMTLSGGEPSAQPDFALALLQGAHDADIHCAMETAGIGSADFYRSAAALGCAFLFDVKVMDPQAHRRLCGVDNSRILAQLLLLLQDGSDVTVRMPLIPGENDDAENIRLLCDFLRPYTALPTFHGITLMPYHNTARGKYLALNRPPAYDRDNATPEEIDCAVRLFQQNGFPVTVSGR